jgi:hypothetical protein
MLVLGSAWESGVLTMAHPELPDMRTGAEQMWGDQTWSELS